MTENQLERKVKNKMGNCVAIEFTSCVERWRTKGQLLYHWQVVSGMYTVVVWQDIVFAISNASGSCRQNSFHGLAAF